MTDDIETKCSGSWVYIDFGIGDDRGQRGRLRSAVYALISYGSVGLFFG